MFGRRFPFLPSNWCRGTLVFKREGEGEKKRVRKARRGKNKPTDLPSSTEPKLGFNGSYSGGAIAWVIKTGKWGRARIIIPCFYLTAQEKYCVNT